MFAGMPCRRCLSRDSPQRHTRIPIHASIALFCGLAGGDAVLPVVRDTLLHRQSGHIAHDEGDDLSLVQTAHRIIHSAPATENETSLAATSRAGHAEKTTPRAARRRNGQTPEAAAAQILANLSQEQKFGLLRGVNFGAPGFYTGNVPGIPEQGVPWLKAEDAGNGFRPMEAANFGTTTAWPCMLAMAATWDPALLANVASAIGDEFKGKGANVILGPSVNVHRVARNGRNFEYLSGEDPYLGAQLVQSFVNSIQARGVMATIKHYAFNEQETNRATENSIVDARTAWELYYPPFEAAVQAGIGAFMCSYNQVNGTHACGNHDILLSDLRGSMNFTGIVMSDWFATHSAGFLSNGLDIEMPGVLSGFPSFFTDQNLTAQDQAAIDTAATHVLSTIFRLGLDSDPGCTPPCFAQLATNLTNPANSQLARMTAAQSIVLLKNDGVLPLNPNVVQKVAVVGIPAILTDPYIAGGGSGYVPASYAPTPLASITQRANAANITVEYIATPSSADTATMQSADVILYVAATGSSEGIDRDSLNLDLGANEQISAIASIRPTVVLMQTPGAVLTPWRDQVAGIANLFLGGQETGNAWADVLFGDVSPEGKLPIMLPNSVADTIEPGMGDDVIYGEGLFTSYRSPTFVAAFPFGHGLSYTTFTYGPAQIVSVGCAALVCVELNVTNSGSVAGREVAQAYVNFGNAGPETPTIMLRGFHKTSLLQADAHEQVRFDFTSRDLSVHNVQQGGWVPQQNVTVHIGSSSADIRQTLADIA